MTDDYFTHNDRNTRKTLHLPGKTAKVDQLESTQPVQVIEHSISDTGVKRIREAITRNKRDER